MSGLFTRTIIWSARIILGGICFYAGIIFGSLIATALGFDSPPLPAGVDDAVLGIYLLFSSLFVAFALSILSRQLSADYIIRWGILALFAWITLGINTVLEAVLFTPSMASFGFVLVSYGVAGITGAAVIAWMFAPQVKNPPLMYHFRSMLTTHPTKRLAGYVMFAVVAFPVIYIIFGWMVQPLILDFYAEQIAGLRLPGWEELIPIQLLRSVFFLIACLPVLMVWHGSSRNLWLLLSTSLFILVGGVYMFQSYWLPAEMRVFHSLEILAGSAAYAGVLVLVFAKRTGISSQDASSA